MVNLVHQRSCDVPLGLPFNVTQYATFLMMVSQVTNLKPGTIKYSIKDAHIYVNQIDGIKEQIRRERLYNKLSKLSNKELEKLNKEINLKLEKIDNKKSDEYKKLKTRSRIIDMILNPTKVEMKLNKNIKDFFKFDNSKDLKDVELINYKHMGKIDFPIAQ